ncbi:MAG: hypothetical protein UX99_C0031G0009 [Candidatus Amesbacteria bacterium GW2011_GWB1_47_26]|uniref:Uncharacterized protein n=1 Tax=Candidatus Amesbacteria bacterium GW2011_GWC2_45_19 TaxID=1618366 RepID=A0A0G1M3W3_9BACT|nr:MAG: hypothetical protein UX05_C0005G0008 [Candidatus Amesbacteria bacterium GW2011_GWC2_45_19]KKU38386.1 MAG: hypothetical protein UX52_C0007G0039 [Candidatus Amesbacteria bacterium GW2011_GWA1_46_35]KKU68772.1 MAG: hypothetical protein UX93_C0005G0008 [Microgenomates group bacterium GW2011_GWC1_47_20]KKU73395.1 MAG: hypothetical protein UX99_C0031G0009 [Candidatus Amesbacteria bacterium GW2011_GWB1_47_26]KKU78698.1 MAG: hypothetical protein UY06_C0042G0006 [Candidatus Amesbacteria bacteriu
MLELPHVLVGAAIATAIPDPRISLPLALLSHFVTDYIPHWNPHLNTELKTAGQISARSKIIILADAGAALMLGTYIAAASGNFVTIILACFLAVLPDVAEIPYYFLGMKIRWIEKLIAWQRTHQWNVSLFWGILCQLAVVVFALYFTLSA